MNKSSACLICFALFFAGASLLTAQSFSSAIVLSEPGFPSADSAGPPAGALEAALPGARFVAAEQLGVQLESGVAERVRVS